MKGARIRTNRARLALVIGVTAAWSAFILARLAQLQVFRHQDYADKARSKQVLEVDVSAPRGIIYDSSLDELASNVPVSSVIAEPRKIGNIPETARRLARILSLDRQELLRRMQDPERQGYLVVKRRIDPQLDERIRELREEGVYLVEETRRVYPNKSLASHLLGFVNLEDDGGTGVELQFNGELKGKEGRVAMELDARRRSFAAQELIRPVQGHSLVLSVRRSIQYIAERELSGALEKYQSDSGTIIVLESATGRVLAMASRPDFDGNTYTKYPDVTWKNPAISEVFEPGSTFKVVVAAAALEAGLTSPGELIDCQNGKIVIAGHVFHDHKAYGLLTFSQVLEHSSNVGAAKLGLRLGREQLYGALRTYGFGSRTGIDLPGEIPGLVNSPADWSGISIGAISFGHEVGVTSLQILSAINAIANGGYLVRPSVLDRVITAEGELVRASEPIRRRVMSEKTAAAVRSAFEGVVLRGTGRRAALEGYRAAGKTGTAQMIVNHSYSKTDYIASFIGFAPLPDPRVTVMVRIDAPKGAIYGGDVAAPVFQRVAQEALLELRVPPDPSIPLPKTNPAQLAATSADYTLDAMPDVPVTAPRGEAPEADQPVRLRVGAVVRIPDFIGMAKRTVLERCRELGLELKASGSGVAVYQNPEPGSEVGRGEVCVVTFGRAGVAGRVTVRSTAAGLAQDRPPVRGPFAAGRP